MQRYTCACSANEFVSVPLAAGGVAGYDCVALVTNHDAFDYPLIARHAKLLVDTRGVYRGDHDHVVLA